MTAGNVIILGETGRNFAAGMSGGLAFVYDVKGDLPDRCNRQMVDLDQLDELDSEYLYNMINKHYMFTNSRVASFVINDFESQVKNFVKVFPKDYKKVMEGKSSLQLRNK